MNISDYQGTAPHSVLLSSPGTSLHSGGCAAKKALISSGEGEMTFSRASNAASSDMDPSIAAFVILATSLPTPFHSASRSSPSPVATVQSTSKHTACAFCQSRSTRALGSALSRPAIDGVVATPGACRSSVKLAVGRSSDPWRRRPWHAAGWRLGRKPANARCRSTHEAPVSQRC